MNKNLNIALGILVIIVIVIGLYISTNKSDESAQEGFTDELMQKDFESEEVLNEDAMIKEDAESSMEKDDVMVKAGSYESYSPEKIAIKAATGNVVLFFRAAWCPTCRAVDSDIRSNLESIPADLTILDVDYDNSSELKKQYGVTYQHTFVQVDKDGKLINKWLGSPTLAAVVLKVK